MATKAILPGTTADEVLVQKCEAEASCDECESPDWNEPSKNVKMTPPDNTVAIIVDMREKAGAVTIINNESDYVDEVNMDEEGNYVVVVWKQEWWYCCIGETRVAHVRKK